MDGIIVGIVAFLCGYLVFRPRQQDSDVFDQMQKVVLNPRLNPEMLHDEHAFMRIANELGFH